LLVDQQTFYRSELGKWAISERFQLRSVEGHIHSPRIASCTRHPWPGARWNDRPAPSSRIRNSSTLGFLASSKPARKFRRDTNALQEQVAFGYGNQGRRVTKVYYTPTGGG